MSRTAKSHIQTVKTPARRKLLRWYRANARDLPWRKTHNPYRIWLSEIMLQQTRVEAVIGYYKNFLLAFPTLCDLAAATEDEVLKCWEGLGYYSRARNLHKAAKYLVNECKAVIPKSANDLQTLPGIGRYTAAAIASIAHGEAVAVVDGNVKRVLARLCAIRKSVDDSATEFLIWDLADALLAPRRAGDFNQAMMELGARICLPRTPKCETCPLASHCLARARNLQATLPVRKKKKPIPHYTIVAGAIRKQGNYLIGRRPAKGMLGGLWEFPGGKVEAGETLQQALRREVLEETGLKVRVNKCIASVDHAYSHFSITLHVFMCSPVSGRAQTLFHSNLKWVSRKNLSKFAFPKANLTVLPLLQ